MGANWKTTAIGAGLAVFSYLGTVGDKLPETKDEWFKFAVGCGIALLGYLAKDSWVGLGGKSGGTTGGPAGPGA